MEIAVLFLVCAGIGAYILSDHQKSGTGFAAGCLLGPIGVLVALYERSRLNRIADQARIQASDANLARLAALAHVAERDEIQCSYCAEKILREARVCKHCGRVVAPEPQP